MQTVRALWHLGEKNESEKENVVKETQLENEKRKKHGTRHNCIE